MKHLCDAITELWVDLNPTCSVHGCEIDPAGTVTLFIWYGRSKQETGSRQVIPLELCIGNPPNAVIRSLQNALRMKQAGSRLSARVTGKTIIDDQLPGIASARRKSPEG